ncbi:MAG: hypothetical protein P4L40_21800 [Terracidiphilus sp.]|nr:hypothetical protein [Terracidiphilus sp.]
MRRLLSFALGMLICSSGVRASAQVFDLIGPKVDVHVKRGQVTLPIGQVPNLLPGDRIWVHPDFPESQSARYILIVAFLRGVTNPPPNEWFTRVDTWLRTARDEGVFVTVPADAQQALLFLAPETGGDFATLRNAVRGRPGVFVRATQDLQAASWDRMRLDVFLDDVKVTSQTDPKLLKERAEASARSLGIKVNQDCFTRPIDQQAACLSQHTEGLVMDDSNAQTRVAQIASGSTADLMSQLSYSNVGGSGAYSPYVGAVVDTVKILSQLHTAHFQYIPALALPTEDTLNLRLNVPPSFRDPKSVVVVALPPVGPATLPPLHPVDPAENFCAQKPDLVLPAEGAPLVLGTPLAHNLFLHIESKKGPVDVPVFADSAKGGLVLAHPVPLLPEDDVVGTIRGKWGFDDWTGPTYHFHSVQQGVWRVAESDKSALVVGREDTLHLEGVHSVCVDKLVLQAGDGGSLPLTWKSPKPNQLEVALPMQHAAPGPVTIEIKQSGLEKPDTLTVNAYAEAASLDRLTLAAGDATALLTGTRLDEVAKATLDGITWTPVALGRTQDVDQLSMNADRSTAALEPERHQFATVLLRDGRELRAHVTVNSPRPQIVLLNKGAQESPADTTAPNPVQIHYGSMDDLPASGRLVFSFKSRVPANFPRDEKIEIAAADGSFHSVLSLTDGSLILSDATTAMAVVEPLARFGASAFGPIQARPVAANGIAGDWMPLGTLVRVPGFHELRCPRLAARPCTLTGVNLFLASALAATPDFGDAVPVQPDFTGTQLTVPHPVNGAFYLKLRDDPATVQTLTLPVLPMPTAGPVPAKTQPTRSASPEPAPAASEPSATETAATAPKADGSDTD